MAPPDVDLDRLDLLVLMRVSSVAHPRPATLCDSLVRYVVPPVPRAGWPALFDDRVEAMHERGWLDGFRITGAGEAHLKAHIGVSRVEWRAARGRLAALALESSDDAVQTDVDGLTRRILGGEERTLTAVVDRLVWRTLTDQPGTLTLDGVRKWGLERLLGRPHRGPWRAVAHALAARRVGAVSTDAEPLIAGLTSRWLTDRDVAFARDVLDVARRVDGAGRWGRGRVFLASAWQAARHHPFARELDLPTFKDRLVAAHRAGRLVLQRADLVAAMDPELVAQSEVQYLNASFHFIDVEAGSAS